MKDNSKSVNLNVLNVALMFVGAIMGAGFASGRELWQFFGVFGIRGKIGVLLVGILFILLGTATAYIARKLGTNEMGRIIAPGNNQKITNAVSWFMAIILFTVHCGLRCHAESALRHQSHDWRGSHRRAGCCNRSWRI